MAIKFKKERSPNVVYEPVIWKDGEMALDKDSKRAKLYITLKDFADCYTALKTKKTVKLKLNEAEKYFIENFSDSDIKDIIASGPNDHYMHVTKKQSSLYKPHKTYITIDTKKIKQYMQSKKDKYWDSLFLNRRPAGYNVKGNITAYFSYDNPFAPGTCKEKKSRIKSDENGQYLLDL